MKDGWDARSEHVVNTPTDDFAEPYDDEEDLIGAVPAELPYLPDLVQEYGKCDPEEQAFVLHQMMKATKQPADVLAIALPDFSPQHRVEVAREYRTLHARHEAKQLFDQEQHGTAEDRPSLVSLTDFLAVPDEPVAYRVDGLWPKDGRIVLAAQNKSGKTTLTGNLIRSLVDGDLFLDAYDTETVRRVVLLDDEMSPNMIRSWLRDQAITNTDAVDVVSLRGRLSTFDLLNPLIRSEWAQLLGPADVLIFDCLRPALDSLGLSEDKDAGRFLVALDELCREAALSELLVVHHMGHSNERSRGDSRIEDWPDAKWKIIKDENDDRFFSAFGRDVDHGESRLAFDPDTRRLSINGPGRKQLTVGKIEDQILLYVAEHPGCSVNAIKADVDGDNVTKGKVIKALLQNDELVMVRNGQKHCHYLPDAIPQNAGNP